MQHKDYRLIVDRQDRGLPILKTGCFDENNTVGGMISKLIGIVDSMTGTPDERAAERQRAEVEISRLTSRIEELTGTLDERTAEGQRAEEDFTRKTNEFTGELDELRVQLDGAVGQLKTQQKELDDREEEISGLGRQADILITELDSVIEENEQQENAHDQEVTGLCKKVEELNESLKNKEMLLVQRSNELDLKNKEASWLNDHISELKEENHVQSESMRTRSESHASVCEGLNGQISSISDELECVRAAYGEIEIHAEKLENLNRALHESSDSENALHKTILADKVRENGLLRTRLEAANECLQGNPENSTANENLQLALNNLETKLKETEAEREIYCERATRAADLEAEVEQLRSDLLEAGDATSPGSVDANALQTLQDRVTDLQSALESSQAKHEALGRQLRGHEELEQEVLTLREAVQQSDSRLLEQAGASVTEDSLQDDAEQLRAALSASEEKCLQLQAALSSSSPTDGIATQDAFFDDRDSQPHTVVTDRIRFLSCLNELLAVPDKAEVKQTVMYILLDNFIQVRDKIGIMNSEQVLNEISGIITSHCDTDDVISRFGDCTFAILAAEEDPAVTQEKANMIRAEIESHIFESAGQSLITTTSIGICSVRENDTSAEDVISRADLACEAVRSSGGNGVLISSTFAEEAISLGDDVSYKEMVGRTLGENRIELYYQPISSLKDISVGCFEVLTRVVDEDGNIILPGEFYSMAAKSGQTVDIDRYIIEKIIKMMAETPDHEVTLFIKLTRQSVADNDFPIWLIRKIKEYRINPGQLAFEIAESTLEIDIKNASSLSMALNSIGCKIAIEHYRMSTMAQHLQLAHTDYLKIDSGLVQSIGRNGDSLAKVTAIMDMSREHNYMTIAEGVESSACLAIMWELGVNFAQGYFIQPPSGTRDYDFNGSMSDEDSNQSNRATFNSE